MENKREKKTSKCRRFHFKTTSLGKIGGKHQDGEILGAEREGAIEYSTGRSSRNDGKMASGRNM